jgi:hypothetical protein
MAKCWLCSTKKGKRYCSPLDKIICPTCCAANRLKKIDCNEDCRYLSGVALQIKRAEEKEFSELMNRVPHGEHDDIFKEPAVAFMAYDIETFVRDIYVSGAIGITDKTVREAYKNVYAIQFKVEPIEEGQLDELTKALLGLYSRNIDIWKFNMNEEMIGQVFLRLMISVKKMSGGTLGEFGYLNYLKNNLGRRDENDTVVVEDKFGRKQQRRYK